MHSRKRSLTAACAAAALVSAVFAAGGPASASASDDPPQQGIVVCNGQATVDYDPGINTAVPRDVTYSTSGTYEACPVNDGSVASATYAESGESPTASCAAFVAAATGTITWNTGEVSAVQVGNVEVSVTGTTVVTTSLGTITDGRYAGHLFNATITIEPDISNPTPCLTDEGLTHGAGPATLTVL